MELVLSNHEEAIPANYVEGRYTHKVFFIHAFLIQTLSDHCNLRKFDDIDVKAEWLHLAAWYYQLECEFRLNKEPLLKVCKLGPTLPHQLNFGHDRASI